MIKVTSLETIINLFFYLLINWLMSFFNKDDFKLIAPITLESSTASLEQNKLIRVNIGGYGLAVLLGAEM